MEQSYIQTDMRVFLIGTLVGIAIVFIVADYFEQENYPIAEDMYATDVLFILLPVALVVLSVFSFAKQGLMGSQGKAWLFFTAFAVCWIIAEQLYSYDRNYDVNDIDSYASDIFWFAGYFFLFLFSVFYLKMVKSGITKKSIIYSSVISASLLVSSLFIVYDPAIETIDFEYVLALTYPIADSIVLIPAIIGVYMFLRGKVNFLWSLLLLGIILNVIADTVYLVSISEDSYYPGHPVDILYLWAYALFVFGVYNHIKLFKIEKSKQSKQIF